jgi:hypothetical protein
MGLGSYRGIYKTMGRDDVSRTQIFTFALFGIKPPSRPITSSPTKLREIFPLRPLPALAGRLVSPIKVRTLAVSITKRNLDFLRVEDFGKKSSNLDH